ncbi:MAG TPA: cytochrome C oxidase subunit IV family protein [Chloroflexota bacterium]|nr:cytochrome C oxidase subunit IV family protein [Chloroflexota bacterium]
MSAHAVPHTVEHHPGAKEYIAIGTALTVITALEVTVYYVHAVRPVLPPILIALSALKFALVVMFYMHLKFDNRMFTGMFLFGLATAAFTAIAFLALFGFVRVAGA